MPERPFAEFNRVEGVRAKPYFLSGIQADTLFVDLRTDGADLAGDLMAGFEYTPVQRYSGAVLGRVRVTPVDPDDVPDDVRARLQALSRSVSGA